MPNRNQDQPNPLLISRHASPQASAPLRLVPLKEACLRIGVSERTWHRDHSILPGAILRGARIMFIDSEIDAFIVGLAAKRDKASTGPMGQPSGSTNTPTAAQPATTAGARS